MIDRDRELPGPAEVDRIMAAARRERSRAIGDGLVWLFRLAVGRPRWGRTTTAAEDRRGRPAGSEMLPPALRLG